MLATGLPGNGHRRYVAVVGPITAVGLGLVAAVREPVDDPPAVDVEGLDRLLALAQVLIGEMRTGVWNSSAMLNASTAMWKQSATS